MQNYRCRFVAPMTTGWHSISSTSPEEAANDYHSNECRGGFTGLMFDHNGTHIYFAKIEVEGHGEWVSRVYSYGIWRKGGVRQSFNEPTLQSIAKDLGYEHDPQTLLEEDWECEETMDEARSRRA